MGGDVPPREHIVECLKPRSKRGKPSDLAFVLDGNHRRVSLEIGKLSEQMLSGLSDRALDLLEIAGLVYAVDALASRGGTAMSQMGQQWHRRFIVRMSVRDLDLWQKPEITEALEKLLFFLSNDRFEFEFGGREEEEDAENRTRFFKFDKGAGWQPNRVLMFSGGLDSFAGALEEISDHGHQVALVSHFSASKIAPVQRDLANAISKTLGEDKCRHYRIRVQIPGKKVVEGTHRTRSFLFAVLGSIVADLVELDRVSFHENGVVSLNLPPVGNVLGARATRTTHPKTLALFTGLISQVFRRRMRVDNPFFWKTKTDVVETIRRLGFADHIRDTHSCADVHNRTKQYIHCGRCSQCIDRRFAMLAAGLQAFDPAEAYRVDLMEGERPKATDREIALSYVRNARFFEVAGPNDILREFPAVIEATSHLGEPAEIALKQIAVLLQRHGAAVSRVMRNALEAKGSTSLAPSTLPRLYSEDEAARLASIVSDPSPTTTAPTEDKVVIAFYRQDQRAMIEDAVEIKKGATHLLLWSLAEKHLEAKGQGLDPLEYPAVSASELTDVMGYSEEGNVRQLVTRSRSSMAKMLAAFGLDEVTDGSIIENVPGQGYRLNPDLVEVRVRK